MSNDFNGIEFDDDGNMIIPSKADMTPADQAFIDGDFDAFEMVRPEPKPVRNRTFNPATLERRRLLWGDKK